MSKLFKLSRCVVIGGIVWGLGVVPARAAIPSAPTNLVSAADSQTQITLWWTDASSDETGFRIERSATGSNGWAQIASAGANVATYANTGLTANTLWYYRVCATNSSGASGYANIANAHTAYYYNHGTPVWRALLLVYTNTAVDWVDSNHVTNNVTGSLSPSGVLAAEESFRLYAARAEKYSDRECIVQYDIVHVDHAVTNVTDEGGLGTSFWLSPEAIAGDLDRYAPRGVYDSILVHWYRGNMPARGWGLGMGVSGAANGATYCTVTEAWDGAWNGNNVWLHEWLHGSENVYAGRGYRQPAGGADGASSHGYPETENWGLYYHDDMTCKVWDTNAPAMFTGTPAQGYRGGSVVNSKSLAQADYFSSDTLTRYKKAGTAVWQSGDEYVALGTTSAATNSMYTTLIPTNSPTLTGRVFVPASGVGTNDTVSVALRSGTTEWWATIEYGTNLTKQFSLIRNGTRQAVSVTSVATGYWYTVKIAADYAADTLRMKAWRDAVNEPTNWLCSAALGGWKASEVGFRHYGKGTLVNDLFMATPEPPSFTNIVTGLPGIELGAVRWGDYDNDGKLDILIVGNSDAGRVAAVYHNTGAGTFADIGAGLPALSDADAQWGDYNNDGYLDILISGNTGSGSVTRIYRNNGNGTFTDINAGLQGFLSGRVSWGDYNNDGKLDILVAGYASGQKSKVYRNDGGGIFTDINAGLIGSEKGVAKWGDYDNDGYLDILLAGYTGSAYSTKIYHNNGDGTFSDINAGLHGVGYASGAWGDYDNDGYLDFAISGFDGSARPTIIYHNDGDGTFTEINAYLTSVADSDITWGDYDNDGDLDLLYGGYNGGIATYLYRNEGNGTFSTQAIPFANVRNCSMAWGDYDNDGRLDVLLSGYDGAIRVAGLYRNADASVPVNTVPAAPSGLSATATDPVTIRLSWNATTDGQTLANGLTYNLRVGTNSGGSDVVGPMADTANGWRRIPAMGGVSGTNCVISGLVNGATYYWSVQAVDSAFAGGAFATQGMFTAPVPPVVTTDPISNITVNSAQCGGNLTAAGTPAAIAKGLVWNTAPHPAVTNYLGKTDHGAGTGSFSDTITSLTPGQSYYVRAYASSSLGATYGAERIFSPPMTGVGNAGVFDGGSNYVQIADANDLALTNNFTLECWFKADGFGSLRGLVDKYHTSGACGYFLRLNERELDFDQKITSGLNLQAGRWYHAAAVNSNGTRMLYVNGVAQTLSGTTFTLQANSDPLRLGSDYGGRYFDGQMEEVRIWNVVRSANDIRDAMHHKLSGSETGLVAYYRFDQTGGAGLPDVSGNGHDGAAVNGFAWTNSTFPCAVALTNSLQLRGAWSANTTTLGSDRLSVLNATASGTDFAIFGHDDATDGQQNTTDIPSKMDWRIQRTWQVELAGAVSGTVRIDTTGLTDVGDGSRLCLLVDGDGAFTNATEISGSFSSPIFAVSSQALASNVFYTLAKLGAFPGVTTAPITGITATNAVCGGTVTNQGANAVIARGVCWSTNGSPTIADSHTLDGSGLGAFTSTLTDLMIGQTYYVRAYAANSSGTEYGEQRSMVVPMTVPGNALAFDGISDHVQIADANDLDMTSNFTLECWFKADSFGGLRGLVDKYQNGGANGYFLRLTGTDLDFDQKTTSGLNLQAGRWYHVAAVNSSGTLALYLNGVAQTLSGSALSLQANSDPIRLGSDFSSRYFAGQMDEVRVWNIARAADDIRDQMHKELTGSETGLVAYYHFNQVAGTMASDTTANGHNGTLVNGLVWTNSTIPCANLIAASANLRGAWLSQNNSLASSLLCVTNAAVAGTDFRIFGHDSGALTNNTSDKPAVCGWRLNRVWQMEGTGALTGGLVFNCSAITNLTQDAYRLCVLADADGVFSNATVVVGSYNSSAQILTISGQSLSNGFFYTLAEGDWPSLTTAPVSNVSSNSAQCGGNVMMTGGAPVTARGCVWSTNANPTVESSDGLTLDGSGSGSFTSQLTGLTAARVYYVRAYAVSSSGTGYGAARAFTSAMTPPGNALVFDGGNDYVRLPGGLATTVGGTAAITIEYWFKGSQLQSPVRFQDGNGYIVAGWSATGPKYVISTDGGTDNGVSVGAEGTVENGQWHHLAMTWQRNTVNGFKSYLDGVLVAQRTSADVALPSLSSATPYLGCYNGTEFLAGCLDEVRVWSVARSQDELRDAMHHVLAGSETNLVAYYKFDNLSGTLLTDVSTNKYDGALQNMNDSAWVPSTIPCAAAIADRSQLRGAWAAKTNSLASGRLVLTNGLVTGTVFAVFGHDNATESQNASDKPAAAIWRLNRAWRMEQNGAVTANLQFDTTGFTGPFALLVDADGIFSNSALVSGLTENGTFTVPKVSLTNGTCYTFGRVDAPLLTTGPISNITWSTAIAGGNVTNQGGSAVTARGCVWSQTVNPTVENHEGLTTNGSGTGVFSSSLTGLVTECTYYVRAYAVNGQGTSYGAEQTFATLRALPQVTTSPISNITYYSAQGGGNVTNEGQTTVTARGVCWNTTGSPTIANSHTTDGSGPGTFSSAITGIVERQVYYVRAYASNTQGVAYGDERSFTTPMIQPGNCLDFDGIDDKAASFGDIGPIPTNDVTVEVWVQLDTVANDDKIVCRRGTIANSQGYILGINNGMLYPEAWDTAGTRYTFQAGVIPAGQWTHLAIVYQRNNALIGYVNGVEVGRTNVANLALRVHSQNGVYIAVGPDSFANYADGRIDEVRVWHIARTEEQIRDDMHRTLSSSESGLSAYYDFDRASGDTLPDLTSNGSTYAYLNNMTDSDWVAAAWPCAHVIDDWSNLRAVWIDRTNSLASSIMSIARTNVTGTAFALVGHDGGPLARNFTDSPAPLYWRLNRCWRTEDGGVSSGAVAFDCSSIASLISDTSQLRLLVDYDGVFANASVLSGSYSGSVFTVTGQPLTNGMYYTIGEFANLPGVTTAPISNVAPFTANGGGEVLVAGTGSVTGRGVCWNTTGSPTTNDAHTADGSGTGTFASVLANLTPSTSYHVRAYAVNNAGTAYGNECTFTTLTAFAQVTTAPASNITHNAATCGGNVTNEGPSAVTARGVCWSTSGNPTITDAHTVEGSGLGAFVSQLTGLSGLQTYHVRAYAINSAGVSYGNEQSLTTLITPPGNALDFNNNSIATGSGLTTNFANRMTLECWVYHDELTNRTSRYVTVEPEMAVIRHDTGNNGRLHTYFKLNGSLRALTVDNVLQTGRWYHVASVWDSTNITLYLNGTLLTTANYASMTLATNSGNVTFGSAGEYLNGRLDEVRIWKAGRTQSEIRDAMHKQLSGTEPGLAAYYPCNESSGTVVHDIVSGANGTNLINVGWASSTFPCANRIGDRTNLRGAWLSQTNAWASSLLSVTNAVVSGTDFRVFGHDGGALTNNTADKPTAYLWRLNRAWQTEGTGALTGALVFDCAGITNLIQNTARLRLLVNNDGVFSNASGVAGTYASNRFSVAGQSLSTNCYYTLGERSTTNWVITATAGAHGTIAPSGAVLVPPGGKTNFVMTPASYWHVGDVTTNSASIGAVSAFTWSNVVADGTINATFAENLAAQGTPQWWMAQYGLTNGASTFDQAETNYSDGDTCNNGQEYLADTDPTNPASYFKILSFSNSTTMSIRFLSSSNRLYTMNWCSNLVNGVWTNVPGAGPRVGTGGADVISDTNSPSKGPFYRLKVELL